jgi:hypothetical protein
LATIDNFALPWKKVCGRPWALHSVKRKFISFSAENGDQPDESNHSATEMTETKAVDDYKKTGKQHSIFFSVTKKWLSLYFCS